MHLLLPAAAVSDCFLNRAKINDLRSLCSLVAEIHAGSAIGELRGRPDFASQYQSQFIFNYATARPQLTKLNADSKYFVSSQRFSLRKSGSRTILLH